MKGHQSICLNSEQEGNSITTCRQTLHRIDCNVFQWNPFTFTQKQLPSCCLELVGLQTSQYYLVGDKEGLAREPYVTGYMVPYSENSWKDWLKRFSLQSGCEYTLRTGIQKNEKSKEREELLSYKESYAHIRQLGLEHTIVYEVEKESLNLSN